ncbi:hypothetical protein [Actinokineospora bangkokensis]|uniref:Ornithine cyclodeaminase n=1 Tax=Actinokineospora bangkokensis TaxID=1193682 RepID=A0A1Q9LTF9_9PSEU|nr:hypothetical protein [Actinokineospora bangkokensis]OLR95318.1 hypothetical protein BJP25_06020 [Actinokineospora bangkokensis]
MPLLLSDLDVENVTADPEFVETGLRFIQDALGHPAPRQGAADWPVRLNTGDCGDRVALFAADDGALLGVLAADPLAAWRTALPGGLVARYLAPAGARVLGVRGGGPVAAALVRTLTRALPSLSRVVVDGDAAFADLCRRRAQLPVDRGPAEEVEWAADVLAVTGEVGAVRTRPGTLVLAEHPVGPRPAVAWHVALRDVLAARTAPSPDGAAVVLGGSGQVDGWEEAVCAWALRRAWELDLGRSFTLD